MTEDTRWLSLDEQQSWRALLHGSARLFDTLDHELREQHGVSLAEYDILVRLEMAPQRQRRMADLADQCKQSRSRLSHTIARMEKTGLVSRCSYDGDKRGVSARLTDTGYDLLVAAAHTHVTSVRAYLVDPADPADLAAMGRVFRAVENTLDNVSTTPANP